MSENSIEFSLSNSEQRDSWLNSGHRTLDADTWLQLMYCALVSGREMVVYFGVVKVVKTEVLTVLS